MTLASFLARHNSFGGWRADWDGVPLESKVYLSDDLPPREYIGSVRAMVLRGDEVLLVHSSPPNFNVGGRCEPGETIGETLHREVGEECGWRVAPIAVIGFVRSWHLDDQRPDWGRPAPEFIDPLFVVTAVEFDPALLVPGEVRCEFVPVADVARLEIDRINQTLLGEAVFKRANWMALGQARPFNSSDSSGS